ncbi:unnamed protein product [Merluccius merluccius]
MSRNPGFLLLMLALLTGGDARSTGLDSMTSQTHAGRLAELVSRTGPVDGSKLRTKRSVFLHSGVRICPKETMEQVLASHQAYYQLRAAILDYQSAVHVSPSPVLLETDAASVSFTLLRRFSVRWLHEDFQCASNLIFHISFFADVQL